MNDGDPVETEYGSDLDTSRTGSAFPPKGVYAKSGWNLTNLPKVNESVLKYINNISGITYVTGSPFFFLRLI
jgi:hypothetical protein